MHGLREDPRFLTCNDMSTALILETMQGGPYGENLGSGYSSGEVTVTAWANESTKYDFKAGEFRFVRLFIHQMYMYTYQHY